jgi:Uma2 family endonuclease
MATYPVRTRRWTRAQYERLADLGVFGEDEPLELIGGHLIVAEPKGNPHAVAVGRVQDPVALDDESEPEPDVAVVAGSHRDYLSGHPARPVLVVEVAESSLPLDRERKGSLYARAGLSDYWIVNLVDQQVEIYRVPGPDAAAAYGWRYQSVTILDASASISPLAAPTARVATSDLLP